MPICKDDRQYVPEKGQGWSNLDELVNNHDVIITQLKENLYERKSSPSFAIGQRALLVVTPQGNILWDCIALINEPIIAFIKSKGSLKAIAFSHPHDAQKLLVHLPSTKIKKNTKIKWCFATRLTKDLFDFWVSNVANL